jgi:hypothetical protein
MDSIDEWSNFFDHYSSVKTGFSAIHGRYSPILIYCSGNNQQFYPVELLTHSRFESFKVKSEPDQAFCPDSPVGIFFASLPTFPFFLPRRLTGTTILLRRLNEKEECQFVTNSNTYI